MDRLTISRRVRELEAQDRFAEADRLRWLAASAAGADVSDELDEEAPSCTLAAALREAEAGGDLATVAALLGALASPERSSRRAA